MSEKYYADDAITPWRQSNEKLYRLKKIIPVEDSDSFFQE